MECGIKMQQECIIVTGKSSYDGADVFVGGLKCLLNICCTF